MTMIPIDRYRLRRAAYRFRVERSGQKRDTVAVAVGVLIGCMPFYGLHLVLSVIAAELLRVNRLKVYLAANISNPFAMPFLLFGEIQLGAWVRRGKVHCLDLAVIEEIDVWTFGADLLVGSLVVGSFLGAIFGGLTLFSYKSSRSNPKFSALVERSAARYAASSFTAWEFAKAKMRFDSIYRLVITENLVPGGGAVLDLGCGQGLMLALLAGVRSVQEEPATVRHGISLRSEFEERPLLTSKGARCVFDSFAWGTETR